MARQLGELEAEVMDRLWTWQHPATVREVLDDLVPARKLAYTTVMTVMDNLHRKGLLSREQDGRAYRYSPVHTRADHAAELIASAVATSEDRTAPLLRFVEQMDADEVRVLRASLERLSTPHRQPPGRRKRPE